jgi:hypothetical protein
MSATASIGYMDALFGSDLPLWHHVRGAGDHLSSSWERRKGWGVNDQVCYYLFAWFCPWWTSHYKEYKGNNIGFSVHGSCATCHLPLSLTRIHNTHPRGTEVQPMVFASQRGCLSLHHLWHYMGHLYPCESDIPFHLFPPPKFSLYIMCTALLP